MYEEYKSVRGDIALDINSLLTIDTTSSSQICDTFGIHPSLPALKALYDDNHLTFFANMGVLQMPANKDNWRAEHDKTALFAHNTQTRETATVDILDEYPGLGIGGRILDVLAADGYRTGAISVAGSAPPIVSKDTPLLAVNPTSFEKFNPIPWSTDIEAAVKQINRATSVGSSFYGDIWSNSLHQALGENKLLYEKYSEASLKAQFQNTKIGSQLASVSKLIKTHSVRGKDRDVFFVESFGWDHHTDIELSLASNFEELNHAVLAFREEMKAQWKWDKVTVVLVSEFGRTLNGNTGGGR